MIALITAAFAGGYFYSDSGIVAAGRGGAFIAGADTQFAQYYNPAGLIHIDRPELNIGFSAVQQHIQFTQLRDDGSFADPAVNQAPPFIVPQLGLTAPLVRDKLVLAVGFVSPFAPSSDYDPDGPQRYSVIDTSIYQFSVGPSLAWRPKPFITFGLGLQAKVLVIGQRIAVSTTGFNDPAGDIKVDARVTDGFTPNFNLGMLIDPVDAVTIGLAVQPPTSFRAKGHAELDFNGSNLAAGVDKPLYRDGNCIIVDDPADPCAAEDGITLDLDLPLVVRAGVAVRPVPNFEIEGAVVWQQWRTLENITLGDIDPEIFVFGSDEPTELPPEFELPAGLANTTSVRLGAEWRVQEDVELRAGGFWENGSVKPQGMSVSLVDPWKVQIGGGSSLWVVDRQLRIDTAFAGIFFPSYEIRDSEVDQVHVDVLGLGSEPAIVGNGDLEASGWLAGFQATWIFGGDP